MDRVLEPEVMDDPEDAREYDEMDHAAVNEAFIDDLLAFAPTPQGVLLDLGTGTALQPILLCQKTPDCRVMAVDMAVSMLDLARYNVEAHSLIDRIQLAQVDAKQMPFDDRLFAGVISNSIIHHLPEPAAAVHESRRVTADGGFLFFRDLMRPGDENELSRLVELHAADATPRQRQLFAESLRAALTVDEMRALVVDAGFDADGVQATSDRHWTWAARTAPTTA